ncbi:MAG: hypothetical protein AAF228_02650 [Pseudomonadota bacterium]
MLKHISVSFILTCSLLLSGCGEPEAQTQTPRLYSSADLIFSYPGNWKTIKRKEKERNKIVVESPGNTVVIIIPAKAKRAANLRKFARAFSKSANKETPITSVKSSKLLKTKGKYNFQTVTEKLTINLLGVEIPHTRIYHRKIINQKAYFIIAQFSNEDKKKIIKGVDMISGSLKNIKNNGSV